MTDTTKPTDARQAGEVDLEAIRKRSNSATHSPWRMIKSQPNEHVAKVARFFVFSERLDKSPLSDPSLDAEFIAHSRQDIPDLLSLVSAQSAELAELRGALEKIAHPMDYLRKEAKKDGMQLDGMGAIQLLEDQYFYREIAQKVLAATQPPTPEADR